MTSTAVVGVTASSWGSSVSAQAGAASTQAASASASDLTAPRTVDLVLANASIVDGEGTPARKGDIAIDRGRIVAVGVLPSMDAKERIDVGGLTVAPGFIDVHTHADDVAGQPGAENFVRMGVTTIVAGNCGSSALDVGAALAAIRQQRVAVNFATLIGHNTVRAAAMGTVQRAPTAEELTRMTSLVTQAMDAGAVGFSTGLQYVPGTYAQTDEIKALAKAAAARGGLYASHMRNEGTAIDEAVAETIAVAEAAQCPVQISHLKIDSPSRWGAADRVLATIDQARARGVKVGVDQYAYTAGSSSLGIRFPSWALEGGRAKIQERLNDDATWARIRREMIGLLQERGFKDLSWAVVATYAPDASYNGLSIRDIAKRTRGSDALDAQLEVARAMLAAGGAQMVYHFMSEADVARIMKHPLVGIASDASINTPGQGVPHPRGYGNTVRVLGRYVRGQHVIPLEEAVRKMTSLPADHFGFADRGRVKAGYAADLVVFDPARVEDRATYEFPHQYPSGLPHVLVNGVFVVRDGQPTAARPGDVLTGRSSAASHQQPGVSGR